MLLRPVSCFSLNSPCVTSHLFAAQTHYRLGLTRRCVACTQGVADIENAVSAAVSGTADKKAGDTAEGEWTGNGQKCSRGHSAVHGGVTPASTAGRGEKRGKKVCQALLQLRIVLLPMIIAYTCTLAAYHVVALPLAHFVSLFLRTMSLSGLKSDLINTF